MKKVFLLALALALPAMLASCTLFSADGGSPYHVRVHNASESEFTFVTVGFAGARAQFENVSPGETTDYRAYSTVYRYGSIKVEAGGETYQLLPIDYVGERPLVEGRYTFRLDLEEDRVVFEVRRD